MTTPGDAAKWWREASQKDRVSFLNELGDDAYPVSPFTWYVHPGEDEDDKDEAVNG